MTWRTKAFNLLALPFVFSCNDLPPKPQGELCTIDLPRQQLICSEIPSDDTTPPKPSRKIPLDLSDKYIAFSPDTWENVVNYIRTLKIIAESKKAQLEKCESRDK